MMRPIDRVLVADAYSIATGGFHAVVFETPLLTDERRDAFNWTSRMETKKVTERVASSYKSWKAATLSPVDGAQLTAFVRIDCALCKNLRSTKCKACDGTATATRSCMACDEVHDCICTECRGGRRACSCAAETFVDIRGLLVDAVYLDDVLRHLPEPPVRMAVVVIDDLQYAVDGVVRTATGSSHLVIATASGDLGVVAGCREHGRTPRTPVFIERSIG